MNVYETKVSGRDDVVDGERNPPATKPQGSYGIHTYVRRLLYVLLPLIVLGAGAGGYAYLKSTRPEKQKRPTQERVFAINSVIAKKETVRPKLKLYGTAVSGRRIDIRALVSGRVIEASPALKNGGNVQKNDLLLRIDPFGYESAVAEAKASLAESKARVAELEASTATDTAALGVSRKQVALARKDLRRAQPLAERGTVSKRTVDEREQLLLQRQQDTDRLANTIKVWEAKIAQQKAIIARQEATLALAERRLEETRLLAPFNAYVVEVSSQVGRMVGANDKIATLIDRDWMEARFTLSDEQYGRILSDQDVLTGRRVDVVWSLGDQKIVYPAKIERVAGQLDAATGGVEILARINDPSKPVALRSGAFVEVMVPEKTFVDIVRLPPTALYAGDIVYAIEDERLQERKIKVVGAVGNDILIDGPIADGERVLTTRVSTPGSGVRVREVE